MARKTKNARRTGTGSLWAVYISAWMVLAAGALSYLILAATNPQMARRILPLKTAAASAPAESPTQTRLGTQIKSLNTAVADLGTRVAAVQSTVAEHERAFEMIAKKVDAVASANTTPTPPPETSPITLGSVRPVSTTTERLQPSRQRARRNSKLPPLPTRVVRRPAVKPRAPLTTARAGSPSAPNIINRSQPGANGVTTGSLPPRQPANQAAGNRPKAPQPSPPRPRDTAQPATPPKQRAAGVQFGAPTVKKPATPAAISLARALSLNELQATWEQLVSRHPALLGGLQPRYSQDRSGAYVLLAGPLNDHTHAGRLCQALRASGAGCGINAYTGNAL